MLSLTNITQAKFNTYFSFNSTYKSCRRYISSAGDGHNPSNTIKFSDGLVYFNKSFES